MNVLYLIHHAGQGGTERYVLTVAKTLESRGLVRPYFLYTQRGLLAERMEEAGIPCKQIALPGRYSLRAAYRLACFCREHHIDIIHSHFLRENYIALLSRLFYRKTRVIYTNHLILPNNAVTRLSNRLLSPLQQAVLPGCEAGAAQLMQNGIPRRLITVIYNGVRPEQWQNTEGQALRRSLDIPEEATVLLYSARLTGGKGHLFLLDALSRLSGLTKEPFILLLAGEGPLESELRARARGLPVVFLGFRRDMPALLAASDICVNASESESLCMSILEGMAAGLPVVATGVGGNVEILSGGGGILVPYGDTEALAMALLRMLTDKELRSRCAGEAQRVLRERFHEDTMLTKIYTVYQGVGSHGATNPKTH